MTFDPLLILAGIIVAMILCGALLGFLIGRASAPKARGPLVRFKLSDSQLALIAYEASRAYRIAHGDLSLKSWNNLHRSIRESMVERIAAYRRNAPGYLGPDAAPEVQLQAAIVSLAI